MNRWIRAKGQCSSQLVRAYEAAKRLEGFDVPCRMSKPDLAGVGADKPSGILGGEDTAIRIYQLGRPVLRVAPDETADVLSARQVRLGKGAVYPAVLIEADGAPNGVEAVNRAPIVGLANDPGEPIDSRKAADPDLSGDQPDDAAVEDQAFVVPDEPASAGASLDADGGQFKVSDLAVVIGCADQAAGESPGVREAQPLD